MFRRNLIFDASENGIEIPQKQLFEHLCEFYRNRQKIVNNRILRVNIFKKKMFGAVYCLP